MWGAHFNDEATKLFSSSDDGTVREWDITTKTPKILEDALASRGFENGTAAFCISSSGREIVVDDGRSILTFDSNTGKLSKTLSDTAAALSPAVAFSQKVAAYIACSPDDAGVATANDVAGGAILWNVRTGARRVLHAASPLTNLAYSPDGRWLASINLGTIRVQNVRTDALRFVRQTGVEDNRALRYSPDGRQLLVAGTDGWIRVFDAASGRPRLAFEASSTSLLDAAFSPDGWSIASASFGQTTGIWNPADGSLVAERRGAGAVHSVRFSGDGKHLLIGDDRGVRIWDIGTGRTILAFRGYESGIMRAAFARGETRVVTTGADNTLRLWNVPAIPSCQAAIDLAARTLPHGLSPSLAGAEFIGPRTAPGIFNAFSPNETCR